MVYTVIFVTTKNKTEARKIAQGLLKERLAACINIMGGVESLFWWQGKIDKAPEALMIIKTKQKLFEKIVSKVKLWHSYQNPEIIALPIQAGSWNYLKWIDENLCYHA